jgi:hypothetical protein
VADPLEDMLVIGISTRALFDLDLENGIFQRDLQPAQHELGRGEGGLNAVESSL